MTLKVTNLPKSKENVLLTANNPYNNYNFTVEIDFHKKKDKKEEEEKN